MAQPDVQEQAIETGPVAEKALMAAPLNNLEKGPDLEASLATANNGNGNKEEQVIDQTPKRRGRWGDIVSTEHADLIFILCSLTTGLCDGVVYASFGCFISMQTGNTLFVGLGASGIPTYKPYGWLKSLVSISSFFMGSFTFSRIMRRLGGRKRGTLTLCFGLQSLFMLIAASIIEANKIPHDLNDQPTSGPLFLELIPLFLLAFQFGGQISASRSMGFNELPTVVLTSVYFDIASDPGIADGITKNVKRNRRIGSVVAIVVGAIAAGWLCRSRAEMQSALWISAFIKASIATAWSMWPVAKK